jgi:hypothetical protein
MKKTINYFSRMLGVLLLCAGLVITSCETDDPIGGGQEEPQCPATLNLDKVTATTATFTGHLNEDKEYIKVGVLYRSEHGNVEDGNGMKVEATEILSDGTFSIIMSDLTAETKYYYRLYVRLGNSYTYGTPAEFTTLKHPYELSYDLDVASATDLSAQASANCYIVSESGLYKFKTVKGNSNDPVENVASASILWETFGTSTVPEIFDLISAFCYRDGYIAIKTADTFKEGNAVIAAKDAEGNILWSWHIWLTDQPEGHVYNNNAGTMMDRNLGATSATPGDVGALGLLYQWGRKDPFLGSSSISSSTVAKSTITWPSLVTLSKATIEYATSHPTTFIHGVNGYSDWYYIGDEFIDNTRWTTSETSKSIYDPCPPGWRVPDGGSNGVWSKAGFDDATYDSANKGISFSITSPSTTWYPASGFRETFDGAICGVGSNGHYWSASPGDYRACNLRFLSRSDGEVYPSDSLAYRDFGYSVRCLRESN